MRVFQTSALFALLLGGPLQAGPHVHGMGRLEAAMDGGQVELQLRLPAMDVVGFERAARTDAERQRVQATRSQLLDHARVWQFSVAAGCVAQPAVLAVSAADDGHGDWDVRYRFTCNQPSQLRRITTRVFNAFPRVQRIEVQWIDAAGARALSLHPGQPHIELSR